MTTVEILQNALKGEEIVYNECGHIIVGAYSWGSGVLLAKKLFVKAKINELWRKPYPNHMITLTLGEELIM